MELKEDHKLAKAMSVGGMDSITSSCAPLRWPVVRDTHYGLEVHKFHRWVTIMA